MTDHNTGDNLLSRTRVLSLVPFVSLKITYDSFIYIDCIFHFIYRFVMHIKSRILLYFALLSYLALPLSAAKATIWRYMKVDNVEVIADLSEKEIRKLHDDIYYFNRILEKFLPWLVKAEHKKMQAIVTGSRSKFLSIIGEKGKDGIGVYGGLPTAEIIVLREVDKGASKTLFHEITHWRLDTLNPRRWLNEGLANLFSSVEFEREKIKVGSIDSNIKEYMQYGLNLSDVSFEDMFTNDNSWHTEWGNDDAMAFYYANSFFFTHYHFLYKREALHAFLAFSNELAPNEFYFKKHFGYDFKELEDRLWEYASKGRYNVFSLKKSNFPEPPEAIIRLATESEYKNALIRAKFLRPDKTEARALLHAMPEDDRTAVETRAILSYLDGDPHSGLALAKQAYELGVRNPYLLNEIVEEKLKELLFERRNQQLPKLSREEAQGYIREITPGLNYFRKNIKSVRLLIMIMDASLSVAPKSLEMMFRAWESEEAQRYPKLKTALDGIRERSYASDLVE